MNRVAYIMVSWMVVCGMAARYVHAMDGRQLEGNEKVSFEQSMIEQTDKLHTLQCSFIQEKNSTVVTEKAVAKGMLFYQASSMLRWEYNEPTASALILNGKDAVLLDKDGKPQGNTSMLGQLGSIIIAMVSGNGLKDSKQFSTMVYDCEKYYRVILSPMQKRLKHLYVSIEVTIDKTSWLASEIVMNEKSGDKTIIIFKDAVVNKAIDGNKFKVK